MQFSPIALEYLEAVDVEDAHNRELCTVLADVRLQGLVESGDEPSEQAIVHRLGEGVTCIHCQLSVERGHHYVSSGFNGAVSQCLG